MLNGKTIGRWEIGVKSGGNVVYGEMLLEDPESQSGFLPSFKIIGPPFESGETKLVRLLEELLEGAIRSESSRTAQITFQIF